MDIRSVELNVRTGFAIDRAERCLAHAIAIVTDDWDGAQKDAREVRTDALSAGLADDLRDQALANFVIGRLNLSRDRLPV